MFKYIVTINNKLTDFNSDLSRNTKFTGITISKKEHFSKLQEADLIMIMASANIITKDQRKILDEKLGIRNTAAHPNSIEVREPKASNVIEDLVPNIISRFQ